MRQDWDFVTMADYEADTRELAESAGHALAKLQREKEALEQLVGALVLAAGGTIKVWREDVYGVGKSITLTKWVNEADASFVFEAKRGEAERSSFEIIEVIDPEEERRNRPFR